MTDSQPLTDRDLAEWCLKIVDSNVDAAITIDGSGIIVGWNQAATDMFGFVREEALGIDVGQLIVPDRYKHLHSHKMAAFVPGRDSTVVGKRVEVEAKTKDGRILPVEIQVAMVEVGGVNLFTAHLRDITDRKDFEQRTKMLIDELNHRVKNTLSAVMAVARQTSRGATSVEDFMEKFDGRIIAVANTHQLLADAESDAGIDLRAIFEKELAPYQNAVSLSGPDVHVPERSALTVSMCIHELVTNALKHGSLSVLEGRLDVAWMIDGVFLRMTWREVGGPAISMSPSRKGFGTKLLRTSIENDLRGSYELDYQPIGLVATLRIPTSRLIV